jgi:hypothetical protein
MKILCPNCGCWNDTYVSGRKRLNHTVKIVYDTLRLCRTVTAAAKKLNCSRGYIYGVLKENNLTVKQVLETQQNI